VICFTNIPGCTDTTENKIYSSVRIRNLSTAIHRQLTFYLCYSIVTGLSFRDHNGESKELQCLCKNFRNTKRFNVNKLYVQAGKSSSPVAVSKYKYI
jgi:hypothetical protein